jgi:hypothetical protein
MALGFTYRLELEDGTPADPPTFRSTVTAWKAGDTIPLGGGRSLRVIHVQPGTDPGEDPLLIVLDAAKLRQANEA